MKKIINIFLLFGIIISSIYAQDNSKTVELINYIQFSTCKIIISHNKGMLESELQGIFNNIDPAALNDYRIREGYEALFTTIMSQKLNDMEIEHLREKMEDKRKNAIFNSFNSFGSVLHVTSSDPISMGISLAYAAVNAGFNYARTVNEIKSEAKDNEFNYLIKSTQNIDNQRSKLYLTSAEIFSEIGTSEGLIKEDTMKTLARIAHELEIAVSEEELKRISSKRLQNLFDIENSCKNFPPYWLIRGIANYQLAKYEEALKCFSRLESLYKINSVFTTNPYYLESAKYSILSKFRLDSELNSNDTKSFIYKQIDNYKKYNLDGIESKSDERYFLFSVYMSLCDFKKAKECMQSLVTTETEAEFGQIACRYYLFSNEEKSKEYKLAYAMQNSFEGFQFGQYYDLSQIYKARPKLKKQIGKHVFFVTSQLITGAYAITDGVHSRKGDGVKLVEIPLSSEYRLYYLQDYHWKDLKNMKLYLSTKDFGIVYMFYSDTKQANFDTTGLYTFKDGIKKEWFIETKAITLQENSNKTIWYWINRDTKKWDVEGE